MSHDTLVRLIRRHPPPEAATPQVLGVDDFAWKRGRRYGTILIDQQRHQVIDILPDREADTLARWLEEHPGVEIVSRDRAGAYADAVKRGAPSAQQVSDRFHLLGNLQTALTRFFERKHETLNALATKEQREQRKEAETSSIQNQQKAKPKSLTVTETQRQARRAKRESRYEEVIKLHEQGASQVAIAALVGLDRDTVRRYLRAPAFPEIVRPVRHKSKLDPYKHYLQQRLQEGQSNATHLLEELRAQGYQGGSTIVHDYLRSVRQEPEWHEAYQQCKQLRQLRISQGALSAREASWLFVCNPRKLKLRQVWQLDPLRRLEEELEQAYQLAQDFRAMVVYRQSEKLPGWLEEAKASGIPELQRFAAGIYRDYDAVCNGLSLDRVLLIAEMTSHDKLEG